MRRHRTRGLVLFALCALGCSTPTATPTHDATSDAGRDGPVDGSGIEDAAAGGDASTDAGSDAGGDAGGEACGAGFVSRCEGESAVVDCFGGRVSRVPCGADRRCEPDASGAAHCVLRSPECDPGTFTSSCTPEGRAELCEDGRVVQRDVCAPGGFCRGILAAGFDCVDASLTPCDPAAPARCEASTAITCSASGYVVTHDPCGADNPRCLARGNSAGCTFDGALDCDPTLDRACRATDPGFLFECDASLGIEYRLRCALRDFMPCTCFAGRREIGPGLFAPLYECQSPLGVSCSAAAR